MERFLGHGCDPKAANSHPDNTHANFAATCAADFQQLSASINVREAGCRYREIFGEEDEAVVQRLVKPWMPNLLDDARDKLKLHWPTEAAFTACAPANRNSEEEIHIYVDGSGKNTDGSVPAWGFCVLAVQTDMSATPLGYCGGPVVTDRASPWFVGARTADSFSAELSSLVWACAWALQAEARVYHIRYDNLAAGKVAQAL